MADLDLDGDAHNINKAPKGYLRLFEFERVLNQDQGGRRIALYGKLSGAKTILLFEKAAFTTDTAIMQTLTDHLLEVKCLGQNDVYSWFLASASRPDGLGVQPDFKITAIFSATEKHLAKYSAQGFRVVTETPEIYERYVRPLMKRDRDSGSLKWVFNILEGRKEQDQVIYREPGNPEAINNDGFMLLPDLNWDRTTMTSLHLLAVVDRRDIWSIRDLKGQHAEWLRNLRSKVTKAATALYEGVEEDQLKLYVHYQPTYYHFHVHVVHVQLDAGTTQAVGKAISFDLILTLLSAYEDVGRGLADATLTYTVGELSSLWREVFGPIVEGRSDAGVSRE